MNDISACLEAEEKIKKLEEKLRLAEEVLEKMKDEHISLCKYHRCSKHVEVSQLNTKEFSGAECGACVLEDAKKKDENGIPMHLRMDMENVNKMLARQMARIDKLTQETFGYKRNILALEKAVKEARPYVQAIWDETKGTEREGSAMGAAHTLNVIDEALLKLRGDGGQ